MNPVDSLFKPYLLLSNRLNKDVVKYLFYPLIRESLDKVLEFRGQWFVNLTYLYKKKDIILSCEKRHIPLPKRNSLFFSYLTKHNIPGLARVDGYPNIFIVSKKSKKYVYKKYSETGDNICSCDHNLKSYVYGMPFSRNKEKNMEIINDKRYPHNHKKCIVCTNSAKNGVKFVGDLVSVTAKLINGEWIYVDHVIY